MTSRLFCRVTMAVLAGLFGGCASFDQHWKDASAGHNGATRWNGKWISEKHHEDGHLRCVLEPQKGNNRVAHFHANWVIFSSNFDMTLEPVKGGPRHQALAYRGTHDLPAIFGGAYHYDATIDGRHFAAHYTSSYDYGTFALERVSP